MELMRLVEFMTKLAMAGISQEAIATRGYDFAFTGLLAYAEWDMRRGGEEVNGLRLKLMEQAASLLIQATGLLEARRHSLDLGKE